MPVSRANFNMLEPHNNLWMFSHPLCTDVLLAYNNNELTGIHFSIKECIRHGIFGYNTYNAMHRTLQNIQDIYHGRNAGKSDEWISLEGLLD